MSRARALRMMQWVLAFIMALNAAMAVLNIARHRPVLGALSLLLFLGTLGVLLLVGRVRKVAQRADD